MTIAASMTAEMRFRGNNKKCPNRPTTLKRIHTGGNVGTRFIVKSNFFLFLLQLSCRINAPGTIAVKQLQALSRSDDPNLISVKRRRLRAADGSPARERERGSGTFTTRMGEKADSRIRPDNVTCMGREAEPVMRTRRHHISIVNLLLTQGMRTCRECVLQRQGKSNHGIYSRVHCRCVYISLYLQENDILSDGSIWYPECPGKTLKMFTVH